MLINIILILSLVNFLAGRRDILGCGLVAFSGPNAPDPMKLLILSLFNEERGRHSCGIACNNKIEWGTTETDKRISQFKKNFIYKFDDTNTVLIHMRHATSGGKEYAHPFGFRKSRKGEILVNDDNAPYQMIGMHNGTITNWEEIKKKYQLGDWAAMDSLTILGAIYQEENFSPISDYVGHAALIFQDVEKDILYVYKGENQYKQPERTLFYGISDEGVYFSSLEEPLEYFCDFVAPVKSNTVIGYHKGEVVSEAKVKRTIPFRTKAVIKPDNTKFAPEGRNILRIKDTIYMYKSRFFVNGIRLNGRVFVDPKTLYVDFVKGNTPTWFVDGFMMDSYTAYDKWSKIMDKAVQKEEKLDVQLLSKDTSTPICIYSGDDAEILYKNFNHDVYYRDGEVFKDSTFVYPITKEVVDYDEHGLFIPGELENMDFEDALWWWKEEFYDLCSEYAHVLPTMSPDKQELIKEIDLVISNLTDGIFEDSVGEISA